MLPIVFLHRGAQLRPLTHPLYPLLNPLYLAALQARIANPKAPIYIIADAECQKTFRMDGVTFLPLESFEESWASLKQNYIHLSPNPYDYELFCLARWFVVRDFMEQYGFERVMHLDSDVMLYADIDKLDESVGYPDLMCSYCRGEFQDTSMGNHSIFSKKALEQFCHFIQTAYLDRKEHYSAVYNRLIEAKENTRILEGISDMSLLGDFFKTSQEEGQLVLINSFDRTQPPLIDNNIILSQGYVLDNKGKKITIKEGIPYAERLSDGVLVPFASLHFQSDSKIRMLDFLHAREATGEILCDALRAMAVRASDELHEFRTEWLKVEAKETRTEAKRLELAHQLSLLKKGVKRTLDDVLRCRWLRLGGSLGLSRSARRLRELRDLSQ